MKKILLILITIVLLACNKEESGSCPNDPTKVMELIAEKDNALADAKEEVIVKAIFCKDFNTEDDNKIEFYFDGTVDTTILADLKLIELGGVKQKVAIVKFKSAHIESAIVRANVSINGVIYSKDIAVSFGESLPESINVSSSSLSLNSDSSFQEITLTTSVQRFNGGRVSSGHTCETFVKDTLGQNVGILVDYQNTINNQGKVTNQFTLGLENYVGKLFAISFTEGANGNILKDTITLFVPH